MSNMIQFVANYDDLSTDKGFQFKFHCDKCRNGYLSRFQPNAIGITGVPISTSIVLSQLGNLYLGLALTEALILRVTTEFSVWKTLIFILLVADIGHLYSVLPLGFSRAFLQWWNWNAIDWGNVGWVYFLALTRICMLLGVGFGGKRPSGLKNA